MCDEVKEARFTSGKLGPGPAAYCIPSSIGNRACYTFGQRYPTMLGDSGPGPTTGPSVTFPSSTNHGKPTSCAYTMASRYASTPMGKSPAPVDTWPDAAKEKPNDYEKMTKHGGRTAPKYSISSRYAMIVSDTFPAPNAYVPSLKPNKPSAPQYSMYFRYATRPSSSSPGPAVYLPTNNHKTRSPDFTFGSGRITIDKRESPGPAAYGISHYKATGAEKCTAYSGKRGPSWTMAQRTGKNPMILPEDNC